MGTPPPGSKGGARRTGVRRRRTCRVEGCTSALSPPKAPPLLKTAQATIPPQLTHLPNPRDRLVPIGERVQQQAAFLGGFLAGTGAVALGHDRRHAFQVL